MRGSAVFDYDGDGRQDLAILLTTCVPNIGVLCPSVGVTVLQSTGAGFARITTNIKYNTTYSFRGIRAGDINGDGLTDLIIGEGNALVVYFNTGGSDFTRKQIAADDV